MLTLTVGDHHTLTAQFLDSLSHVVTDVDPGSLVWHTDDETILNIGPNITSTTIPPQIPTMVTGLQLVIKALSPGVTNVYATYNDGVQQFQNVTQVLVNPPAVASISVT